MESSGGAGAAAAAGNDGAVLVFSIKRLLDAIGPGLSRGPSGILGRCRYCVGPVKNRRPDPACGEKARKGSADLAAGFRSLPAKSSEYTEKHSRGENSATMLMVHAQGKAAGDT